VILALRVVFDGLELVTSIAVCAGLGFVVGFSAGVMACR